MPHKSSSPPDFVLLERLDRRRFVVGDVEYGVQLGDLQHVADFSREFEQLQLSSPVANRREGRYQLANPCAVDGYDLAEMLHFVVGVESAFYPPIGTLYRRRIETWAASRREAPAFEQRP